jgi:hypothetical protein
VLHIYIYIFPCEMRGWRKHGIVSLRWLRKPQVSDAHIVPPAGPHSQFVARRMWLRLAVCIGFLICAAEGHSNSRARASAGILGRWRSLLSAVTGAASASAPRYSSCEENGRRQPEVAMRHLWSTSEAHPRN